MTIEVKKKVLSFISILSTIFCCINLGQGIVLNGSFGYILLAIISTLVAFLPFVLLRVAKKVKHLFFLTIFYALGGFLSLGAYTLLFNLIGIVVSFLPSLEEEGKLDKVIKRHPIIMSSIVILSGLAFLSTSSLFEYFGELIYGFNMLGELCAAIFIFWILVIFKKTDLIFKNRGSIRESIIVGLPFIVYSFYIGSVLLATNMVEGYEFVSFGNILVIIIYYLLVGIFEDFLIRGVSLNLLLDKLGHSKKGIYLSLLISSLLFGIVHFTNLFTGASFQGVLIQVISSTCIGMYFGAIYLRSGNVWTPAILHGVYDIMVSVPSFFMIEEITNTAEAYGKSISNYSWANVGIGLIFVFLALYLLRKTKMNSVVSMLNGKKIEFSKQDGTLKYILIGFGFSSCVIISIFSFATLYLVDDLARGGYDKLLTNVDYYNDYELTYTNGFIDENVLSDEVKILLAINNLEEKDYVDSYSIEEAERAVSDVAIFTNINKDKILESYEDIFGEVESLNYVDVNVSYKTSCSYNKDSNKYTCVTTNNSQSNNINVYSDIKTVGLGEDGTSVFIEVYYLMEDLNTKTLYADSNMKTIFKYDTLVKDISDVKYDKDDNRNRDFWKEIALNNDGLIPTYKIIFKMNEDGTKVYFESSEFLQDSIKSNVSTKEEIIDGNMYLYNTKEYKFTYDKSQFSVVEEENSLSLKYNLDTCFKIEIISSDKWLAKYKNYPFINVNLGNNVFYNYGNEYLIYKDDFYLITINTDSVMIKSMLLDVLSSLEFK